MKKLMLALVFSGLGVFSAQAQDANANAAEITFEKETIDYGKIEKGADGQREFVFTNTGKEPLIIQTAKGSCGCTVPQWPREPIAPGQKSAIKVKYDTKRVGQFHKTVTVQSNAKSAVKTLTIKGVVENTPAPQTTPTNDAKPSSKVMK